MKIAYLIIAYHNHDHVSRMIKQLASEDACFFIHVDNKVPIKPFKEAVTSDNCIFINNRVEVIWGGWSMVEATLRLLNTAVKYPLDFNYYQLLSDSCFPLKSAQEIQYSLQASKANYITINEEVVPGSHYFPWIRRYHSHDDRNRKLTWKERLLRKIRRRYRRSFMKGNPYKIMRPYKGWQWWCLTDDCVRYILEFIEQNSRFSRFYKYTRIPDEMFFHTIIMNSNFAQSVVPEMGHGLTTGTHYIEWIDGNKPKILNDEDFESLIQSGCHFARKFCQAESSSLLNTISANNSINNNKE